MPLLLSLLLFTLLGTLATVVGMKLWARPRAAMERITGQASSAEAYLPLHPSLVFRELLARFGSVVPQAGARSKVLQRRLVRAGYRQPHAVRTVYGARLLLAVVLPLVTAVVVSALGAAYDVKVMAIVGALLMGYARPGHLRWLASQAPPAAYPAGPARCAGPAGDLRGSGAGAGPGPHADGQGNGDRASRHQPGIRHGQPGAPHRQTARRCPAQPGRAHRCRRAEEAGGGADSGRPVRHRRGDRACGCTPTTCAFRRARWPRRRRPSWASSWFSRFSSAFCRRCSWSR